MMGGWVYPTRPGYPDWGCDMDFNVQADLRSARYVFEHAVCPTLASLSVTVETFLRCSDLEALHRGSPLANLIAHQAVPFDKDEKIAEQEARYRDPQSRDTFVNRELSQVPDATWKLITDYRLTALFSPLPLLLR